MSRINPIQSNYQQVSQLSDIKKNIIQNTSFTGGLTEAEKSIARAVTDSLYNKPANFFKWLADSKGELQSQIINACFTTTVAPFWIAYNPFAKTDEKTKKYTALRQPISAVVALAGGLPLTVLINRQFAKLGSEGYIPSYDMRSCPDETDYLSLQFKKAYAEAKKSPSALAEFEKAYLPRGFENTEPQGFIRKFLFNWTKQGELKNNYYKSIKGGIENFFSRLISEDTKNITFKDGVISITDRSAAGGVLQRKIPNITSRAEFTAYLDANNLHRRSLGSFLHEHFGLHLLEDGSVKPYAVEKSVRNINALEFIKKLGILGEATYKKDMKAFDGKELGRILFGEDGPDISKMNLEELLVKFKILNPENKSLSVDAIADLKVSQLRRFMNESMSQILDRFSKPFKNTREDIGPRFDVGAGIDKFAQNIMKAKNKLLSSDFGIFKFFAGIVFNMFIIMVTCTVLNWMYPRVVKALFPHLVKSDEPSKDVKGGNK